MNNFTSILIATMVAIIVTSVALEKKKEEVKLKTPVLKIEYSKPKPPKLTKRSAKLTNLLQHALPGYTEKSVIYSIPVTATSYNPLESQCDDTPLINAWNKLVMPGQVALPQEMRLRLGLKKGQTILLAGYGAFTITDHMNRRYNNSNRVDIISFIPKWSTKFGIKHNVQMYWW